jgi:SAM-dependent methyltransferase
MLACREERVRQKSAMTDLPLVASHYSPSGLRERVRDALDRLWPEPATVPWRELAAMDQFHVRGLAATEELAAALSPEAGMSVLDVGSGLGGPSRCLAATHGCDVTGIDLSAPYVETSEMLAGRTGLASRLAYRQGNALDLPFASSTFDMAWTQHAAMNIADRPALYAGVHRVLKPGGRFALYDIVAGPGGPVTFPVPWAREPAGSFLLSAGETREAVEAAGFEVVSWEDRTQATLEWLAQRQAAQPAPSDPAPLGLHLVIGPDFPVLLGNLSRNFHENRTRVVQAILRRA